MRLLAPILAAAVLAGSGPVSAGSDCANNGRPGVGYAPIGYEQLTGWIEDDHIASFATFIRSCERIEGPLPLLTVCTRARALGGTLTQDQARLFFESAFEPAVVMQSGCPGKVTGYYQLSMAGARVRSDNFPVPLFARPAGTGDLPGRKAIDEGALDGRAEVVAWLADHTDLFQLQTEGSGRIRLADGGVLDVNAIGGNGYRYTKISDILASNGYPDAATLSIPVRTAWLKARPELARKLYWQNQSYAFFSRSAAPMGVKGIALTPGRSLAVDPSYHAIGQPIFVLAAGVRTETGHSGFFRLLIAQDIGAKSEISGPERGDIYFGEDERAYTVGSSTKGEAMFVVLRPRE